MRTQCTATKAVPSRVDIATDTAISQFLLRFGQRSRMAFDMSTSCVAKKPINLTGTAKLKPPLTSLSVPRISWALSMVGSIRPSTKRETSSLSWLDLESIAATAPASDALDTRSNRGAAAAIGHQTTHLALPKAPTSKFARYPGEISPCGRSDFAT